MAATRAAALSTVAVWKTSGLIKGIGIPAPSGPYEVGCHHLMHDNLFIRLYYPTTPTGASITNGQYSKIEYNSKYWKAVLDFYEVKFSGLIASVGGLFTNTKIPAILDAPLYNDIINSETEAQTTSKVSFPVLVFSHGLGSSFFVYSAICCDLASHGFVVAAVEHKDQSACIALRRVPTDEGRYNDEWIPYLKLEGERLSYRKTQVKQRSAEVSQALDILNLLNNNGGQDIVNMLINKNDRTNEFDYSQFKDRLLMEQAAVAGHSFGGATSLHALSEDDRFKCGVILDVYMYPVNSEVYDKGINQPIIFINSFNYQWKDNIINILKLIQPVQETGSRTHSMYTLRGTTHTNQSDAPFIIPLFKRSEGELIPPETAHAVNMELCVAFLKRFLLKDDQYQGIVPLLDGGEGSSEHVLFGTNVQLNGTQEEVTSEEPKEVTSRREEATPEEPKEVTPRREEVTSEEPKEVTSRREEVTSEEPKEVVPRREEVTSEEPKEVTSEVTSCKEEHSLEKNIQKDVSLEVTPKEQA